MIFHINTIPATIKRAAPSDVQHLGQSDAWR